VVSAPIGYGEKKVIIPGFDCLVWQVFAVFAVLGLGTSAFIYLWAFPRKAALFARLGVSNAALSTSMNGPPMLSLGNHVYAEAFRRFNAGKL
jgi:hypothetical protein